MSFPSEHSKSSGPSHSKEKDEVGQRLEIREDLRSMSFEEILKLKEELGAKLYKEAVLGANSDESEDSEPSYRRKEFKRLNKNRPREATAKRQVPFLGADLRKPRKPEIEERDPRFDANCGDYNITNFKENYKFVTKIRRNEVARLQQQMRETNDDEERKRLKLYIQTLVNKNVESRNWHAKQTISKDEQKEVQQAREEGRMPHFTTKKERRAKELVTKFEQLKKSGKLNKHLEKRRKKNAAKDRKKLGFA